MSVNCCDQTEARFAPQGPTVAMAVGLIVPTFSASLRGLGEQLRSIAPALPSLGSVGCPPLASSALEGGGWTARK